MKGREAASYQTVWKMLIKTCIIDLLLRLLLQLFKISEFIIVALLTKIISIWFLFIYLINSLWSIFVSNILKNRSIAFIISDFISKDYSNSLKIFSSKHDVTGIRIYDQTEEIIPNLGVIDINDNETGQRLTVNTGSKMVRKKYAEYYNSKRMEFTENFKMSGSGIIECNTQDDYQKKLLI